jgi:hypothetical protein
MRRKALSAIRWLWSQLARPRPQWLGAAAYSVVVVTGALVAVCAIPEVIDESRAPNADLGAVALVVSLGFAGLAVLLSGLQLLLAHLTESRLVDELKTLSSSASFSISIVVEHQRPDGQHNQADDRCSDPSKHQLSGEQPRPGVSDDGTVHRDSDEQEQETRRDPKNQRAGDDGSSTPPSPRPEAEHGLRSLIPSAGVLLLGATLLGVQLWSHRRRQCACLRGCPDIVKSKGQES